jgi:hypothetical protein
MSTRSRKIMFLRSEVQLAYRDDNLAASCLYSVGPLTFDNPEASMACCGDSINFYLSMSQGLSPYVDEIIGDHQYGMTFKNVTLILGWTICSWGY